MKGKLHLPVLAFAIGGGIVRLNDTEQILLIVIGVIWVAKFRQQRILLLTLTSSLLLGYNYLAPPTAPPTSSSTFSSSVTVQSIKSQDDYFEMIVQEPETKLKTLVSYFPEELDHAPDSWKLGATCSIEDEKSEIPYAPNPGQFDFRKYMASQGVFSQLVVENVDHIRCHGQSPFNRLYEIRQNLILTVERSVSEDTFVWIAALVFGDQKQLDQGTVEWFRDFNLSHILAISGLHVGLFIAGVYLVMIRTGVGTVEQARIFLVLLIPLYAFIAGGEPSVLRASIMATLILFLVFLKIKIPIVDILSITALTLLLVSPYSYSSIGFQFSFLVTFSLILSAPIFRQTDNVWLQSAQISLISQLSILPLQLHYFYEFNPISLLANLILVPYFSFIVIPISILLVLMAVVWPRASLFFSDLFGSVHGFVLEFAEIVAQPFRLSWVVGEVPPIWIMLLFLSFMYLMASWSRQELKRASLNGALFVALLMAVSSLPYFSPKGTVTMLDIGQGDAFVVELPYRRGVILIDAGGPPSFLENRSKTADEIILPFLKSKGITSVDAVIVTHEDGDHNGSVPSLIRDVNVKKLIVHPYYPVTELNVEVTRVSAGEELEINGQIWKVLHPKVDAGNPNDNSIVLSSEIGGKSWMFTGDISVDVEADLMEQQKVMEADVLKVAHHGSDTSTSEEWIRRINPEVALISAGRNNRYGHPHQAVVDRLEDRGILIYQTSREGAVIYTFSGQSGTFSSFLSYNANR
ncbi:DNA internalization-related competence protein ComEC/Rec2 [Halobacillus salinus]|uniref:DNA internalization-related competence protein ComEC/Rec2 n=1 Tax=Halobacillus salinus TaxID=192814 RepID=A0A4Z0H1G8_9BACI|nr:DNA internalization-related competence protein ComEC/Rec2 [Halobacillus salinus]TGB04243.1 DNA internalization-related competence protein ComEC/Rec2 [Halobacillus salinus]